MNPLFTTPITSANDAEAWFFDMDQQGLVFHPEDDPSSIVRNIDGVRLFTDDEAAALRDRIDECYMYLDDPCATALAIVRGPDFIEE